MTTIFERVENALATLSPAVPVVYKRYLTGSGQSLPDVFIAYSLISSPAEEHADDTETLRSYTVQVAIYKIYSLVGMPDVDAAMLAAGFEKGIQRELPEDPAPGGHFGLATEYTYLE